MSKHIPRHTRHLWLLCLLLGLILAGLLVGTLYIQKLLSQVHYVAPETVPNPATQGSEESIIQTTAAFLSQEKTIHILLIGQDRLPEETRARSDAMILCSFDRDVGTVTLTSFLRDLYVDIPGHGKNRLNAAYAAGGMTLLDQTLEKNFGVTIHGNVEVDFTQFSSIIDLLGGVELELRQDEADWLNGDLGTSLTQGRQLLTGSEALAYARIRKLDSDGDFSRTGRHRKLLTAILQAYRKMDLPNALSLMEAVFPLLTTDLTGPQILKYAMSLLPMLGDAQVQTRHIPASGTYTSETIDGMWVLVPDLEANRAILAEP